MKEVSINKKVVRYFDYCSKLHDCYFYLESGIWIILTSSENRRNKLVAIKRLFKSFKHKKKEIKWDKQLTEDIYYHAQLILDVSDFQNFENEIKSHLRSSLSHSEKISSILDCLRNYYFRLRR